jgi:hypothetical protein
MYGFLVFKQLESGFYEFTSIVFPASKRGRISFVTSLLRTWKTFDIPA